MHENEGNNELVKCKNRERRKAFAKQFPTNPRFYLWVEQHNSFLCKNLDKCITTNCPRICDCQNHLETKLQDFFTYLSSKTLLRITDVCSGGRLSPFPAQTTPRPLSRQSPDFAFSKARAWPYAFKHSRIYSQPLLLSLATRFFFWALNDLSHLTHNETHQSKRHHHALPRLETKRRLRLVPLRHKTRTASTSLRDKVPHRSRRPTKCTHRKNTLHLHHLPFLSFTAQDWGFLPHSTTLRHQRRYARSQ